MKSIPESLQALVGQAARRIDTPALVIDLDAMDRNIERMARFARQHGVLWRPHAKLHKSAHIALLLEQAGACGHCVQKVSEAEALAEGGVNNIFISNEVVSPAKLERVARLAKTLYARSGRLAIAVDNAEGVARRVVAGELVGVRAQQGGRDAAALGQPADGVLQRRVLGGAVDLGAVAGGEDGRLHRRVPLAADGAAQALQGGGDLVEGERETTAQIERRGRVVQAEGPDCHSPRL